MMGATTAREASTIHEILTDFSATSGININSGKSQIFFFNTPDAIQNHLSNILGYHRSSLPSKYLGVPLIENSLCNNSWESLIDSLKCCLSSWTFHSLNLVGHLTLLKSILQAIPIYLFSAMAAPKSTLNLIRSIQRCFLWQGTQDSHKWALVKWDDLCKPKHSGGLGLRDPYILNNVMGAKIWWRWLTHPTDLWAKLWRHKYTPGTDERKLIHLNNPHPGSSIWNTAWNNRALVQEHAFWEIRNGKTTLFWSDSWQQLPPLTSMDILQNIQ
jgi:hypothetical protein